MELTPMLVRLVGLYLCLAGVWSAVDDASTDNNMPITGGLLIKDGKQTSCEIVPIGNMAFFVAGNCLDYIVDHKNLLDPSTKYELALKVPNLPKAKVVSVLQSNIHVHIDYSGESLINNIAIINTAQSASAKIQTNIAERIVDKSMVEYSQLVLNDDMESWGNPVSTHVKNNNSTCFKYALFGPNPEVLTCIDNTRPEVKLGSTEYHNIPYGTGSIRGRNLLLYSHSVVDNDDLQNAKSVVSFYTFVSNYLDFVDKTLQTSTSFYDKSGRLTSTKSALKMVPPEKSDDEKVVGGNLFTMDESNADVAESTDFLSSSRQSSDSNNMSDSTVDKSANVSADEAKNSSRSGLSSGAIAGIAVGVSLFVIIVLALAIRWLVLAHKKRSAEKYWDREMNKMQSVRSLGQPGQGDQE